MSEPTPGEWIFDNHGQGSFVIRVGVLGYQGAFVVCNRSAVVHRAEESTANGRLIAGSKKLMALAKRLVALDDMDHKPDLTFINEFRSVIAEIEDQSSEG